MRDNSSKKRYDYNSNSSSDESYSEYSLSINNDCDEERQTSGCKEINRLDHAVTGNLKTNKYQRNDAIENEPKFGISFNLSSGTKYSLPVVTVSLR